MQTGRHQASQAQITLREPFLDAYGGQDEYANAGGMEEGDFNFRDDEPVRSPSR